MSKIIKDLPAKLMAELENNDVTSSFFDDCLDLFFTRFLTTFLLSTNLLSTLERVARRCYSTCWRWDPPL
jgi:hypothetical protein